MGSCTIAVMAMGAEDRDNRRNLAPWLCQAHARASFPWIGFCSEDQEFTEV